MSNIYIQEPPTSGKVLLKTSVGDLELELWTKEAPKACRNFIQLCMEGYYNGTIFHRVVKGFICQGGDPTGTGQGGESIYGQPFKDEIHTRLRFCRRGLLAMANAGKDDNSSQFFFTFSATPELQNKHTIFGKVTGETIYNMLKLEDAIVDANERPTYPQKIIKTEILLNPFMDIVPRCDPSIKNKLDDNNDKKKKNKKVGVKNFKLLSFGEEAEEDEEESVELSKKYIGKGKSAHDSLSDPKLSSVLAIEVSGDLSCKKRKRDGIQQDKHSNDDNDDNDEDDDKEECVKKASKEMKERIISKLQDKKKYLKNDLKKSKSDFVVNDNEKKEEEKDKEEEEEEEEYYFGKDRDDEKKKKVEAIQKEIREFKKELKNEKFVKEEIERKKIQDIEKSNKKSDIKNKYIKTKEEFLKAKSQIPEKGVSREKATQELLMKFRNKLKSVKQQNNDGNEDKNNKNKNNDDDDDDFVSGASWMKSVLHCEEKKQPVLAKDASTKDDDWFEIYDPRNPINKRRRGDNTTNSLNNKSKKSNNSIKETTTRRGGTRY